MAEEFASRARLVPVSRALLVEAIERLDMAFVISEDERTSKRFAATRDKLRAAIA